MCEGRRYFSPAIAGSMKGFRVLNITELMRATGIILDKSRALLQEAWNRAAVLPLLLNVSMGTWQMVNDISTKKESFEGEKMCFAKQNCWGMILMLFFFRQHLDVLEQGSSSSPLEKRRHWGLAEACVCTHVHLDCVCVLI